LRSTVTDDNALQYIIHHQATVVVNELINN